MKRSKTGSAVTYTILSMLLFVYIVPFFMVLINAFKEKVDIVKHPLSLIGERGFILSNFPEAIKKMDFFKALGNSLMITGFHYILFCNGCLYYG